MTTRVLITNFGPDKVEITEKKYSYHDSENQVCYIRDSEDKDVVHIVEAGRFKEFYVYNQQQLNIKEIK